LKYIIVRSVKFLLKVKDIKNPAWLRGLLYSFIAF
jgi:hypothetical protein